MSPSPVAFQHHKGMSAFQFNQCPPPHIFDWMLYTPTKRLDDWCARLGIKHWTYRETGTSQNQLSHFKKSGVAACVSRAGRDE